MEAKPPVIEAIKNILGAKTQLEEATPRPGQPLGGLMPSQKGRPKYLLHDGQLAGLNLANTGLTDEKWAAIQRLPDFKPEHILGLNLSDNQLTALHFPAAYRALRQVFASDNQLKELRFAADCPRLERLQLDNNQLSELLLPEGAGFNQLELVHIAGNPLTGSFEAAAKEGPAAFARFIRRLALQGVAETYEIKMLIVGEGETGKTTLWKFLQDNNHLPVQGQASTVGIGIREGLRFEHADQPGADFWVNLWDFGGQEIQYMTHQFFLTRRSFYVLLADGRREVGNFPYWFKVINLLGADPGSGEKLPVLVLLNEKGNPIPKMPYDPAST
ncbi:MAG TPA: hypothetical protein PKH43_08880, partial [Saprospiraceae bacterium]|nr:hypothetical protein [Saprospiraceae bacterium]